LGALAVACGGGADAAPPGAGGSSTTSSNGSAGGGAQNGENGSDETEPGSTGDGASSPGDTGAMGGTTTADGSDSTGSTSTSTGSSDSAGGGTTSGDSTAPEPVSEGAGVDAVSECVDPNAIGPSALRRVSRVEYTNAVRDLFGVSVNQGDLPADEKLGPFTTNVVTPLVRDNFDRYLFHANAVADEVLADFSAVSGCESTADTACVDAYLSGTARRAFHGTLEAGDAAILQDIVTSLASTDADVAVSTAIEWILMSPRFLFVVEFGEGESGMARLTGSEVAGRLAAFFWRTVPDERLLELADSGALDTDEGVRSQAEAMLADPRSVPVLAAFAEEWLRIHPAGSGASTLEQEAAAQPSDLMGLAASDSALSFSDLLTGEQAPLGPELAQFYGTSADAGGMATLPAERRGLLLSAAFQSSNASGDRPSPVKRGFVVRSALLCDEIGLPADPTVAMLLPEPMDGVSEQEIFNEHSSTPECWGCHRYIDPIGDAFGDYAADGSYMPGSADSTSGTIYFTSGGETAFADTQELLDILATEERAQSCFVVQATRFAMGRPEHADDACSIEAISAAFQGSNQSIHQLMIEIAASPMFLNRNPVVAGGTCR
jgi:hypothetical protein